MTTADRTYAQALADRSDEFRRALAAVDAYLADLHTELKHYAEEGDAESVADIRDHLAHVVALHDETAGQLEEVRRLLAAADSRAPG